jgi:hypothetical protein
MEAMMSEVGRHDALFKNLGSFGSDFSRWPTERAAGAREALLGLPEFRRAYESERALDSAMAEIRDELDRSIRQSGALKRVRQRALMQVAPAPLAGLGWQRIAAAVLVAGMLGGALDLFLGAPQAGDTTDVATLDPLFSIAEGADPQ